MNCDRNLRTDRPANVEPKCARITRKGCECFDPEAGGAERRRSDHGLLFLDRNWSQSAQGRRAGIIGSHLEITARPIEGEDFLELAASPLSAMDIAAYAKAWNTAEGGQRRKRNAGTCGGWQAIQEQNRFFGRPAQGDLVPFAGVPADRGLEDRGLAIRILREKTEASSGWIGGERPPSLGCRWRPCADLQEPAGSSRPGSIRLARPDRGVPEPNCAMIGSEVWRAIRLIVGQGEKTAGAGHLQRMA